MPEKKIKAAGIAAGEMLTLTTAIGLLVTKEYDRLPMALATFGLVLLPWAVERVFRCRLCLPVYLFALVYALGPMLGQCWKFYYTIAWWDKLLHLCGGVMFAIVGAYFFRRLTGQRDNFLACALFALCFSMAIAAAWEFVEFAADRFLGMDMQDDMLITSIHSYLLGDGVGVAGSIETIHTVTVNGTPLAGYIDIGLTDTMLDMLLESLGALVTGILLFADRGRHPLVEEKKEMRSA